MSYLDDLSAIWEMVRASFLTQYASSVVDLWFGDMKVHSYEDNVITLSTPREFKYNTIRDKFMNTLREGFAAQLGFAPSHIIPEFIATALTTVCATACASPP